MNKLMLSALWAAAVLGLVHCGGNGRAPANTPDKQVDACTLLTNEEVAAAMGEPVVSRESGGTADGTTFCNWSAANASSSQFKIVTVMANGRPGAQLYGGWKDQAVRPRPVNLGDEAFTDDESPNVVRVLDSGWFLYVGYGSPLCSGTTKTGCADDLAKSIDLAKKALARLR